MSKGYYLSRSDGIFATGKSPYQFDKMTQSLPRKGKGKNKLFFIPQFECKDDYKAKNIPVEQQLESDTLDQLIANVDFNSLDDEDKSLNRDIKKARLGRILVDTKLQGQRLQERKRELFYDWSERFFDTFSNHFGKLRNILVQLHLNEQQVKQFNQCLQKCLENMQLDLNNIWDQFNQEQQ